MLTAHPIEQINFTENTNAYVVEASAGTGKTWTIERLYIKAILEAHNPKDANILLVVENILVVTFTNDATAELKERLYSQIEITINLLIYLHNHKDIYINETDIFTNYLISRQQHYQKDVVILTRALQNFDQAAIFTIHGFCSKVLKDYQFECQINPEFEVVKDKSETIRQIVFNFIRSQIMTKPEFSQNIDTVMNNLDGFFSGNYDTSIIDRIVNKLPKDLFAINRANYIIKYKTTEPKDINFLAMEITEDKPRYKAEFLSYLINYIYQHYPCRIQDTLSYDELMQKLADSLINSHELADKIFYKYPIAFIDEFQDTDLLQWQIFSTIYNINYDKNKIRSSRGTLVVVGDPKQAIYRFRGADIDTYIKARTQINNHLSLINNYRSNTNIMNFINQLFDLSNQNSSIENSYLGDGINYEHIIASAKTSTNQLPSKDELEQIFAKNNIRQNIYEEEVQIVAIRGSNKAARSSSLLKTMTFEILSLLNANPELKGKIAVLVTKNKEAVELVKYFARFGIKATELKLGNIFATNTANELYMILNALLDQGNRQHFILALTTKIFNISLLELASRENNPIFELFSQRFFRYGQIWENSGIFSLIYAILEDVALDKNTLTNRNLANLWQLSELLNKYHLMINNRVELLFWFKDKIKQAEQNLLNNMDAENEELIRLENDDEQIIITTQHKAKGLEYEILFCPYFKNNITLDGQFDFNYKRPFFSSYHQQGKVYSELVLDQQLANYIVEKDNKEVHRLNYVALTRAKSRIYIYLKQNTIVRATAKYNSREKPDKLIELFGYVKSNPNDTSHRLFNYPQFFSDNPQLAIKEPAKFPGVVVYNRDTLTMDDLIKLKLDTGAILTTGVNFSEVRAGFSINESYFRQSYSGLTKINEFDKSCDYYETENDDLTKPVVFRYDILNDKNLSGAVFGTLFHELCEIYPFNQNQLRDVLYKYNVLDANYQVELSHILKEAFNYPILDDRCLSDFDVIVHELEFNLSVDNTRQIHELICKYFGKKHPFSLASNMLGGIKLGYLIGFMDVCFEHNAKYWVLDYKTNSLNDYTGARDIYDSKNLIVTSMAEHHYYLQYLLYLVALKRYLQVRLQIEDASNLIGGAVYYYVRGIYTQETKPGYGLFVDDKCQELVRELDELLSIKKEKLSCNNH